MLSEVTFKDGYKCLMRKIYNWDGCYIYYTEAGYLIVPYQDVIHSKVSVEEFMKATREAKEKTPIVFSHRVWEEIQVKE